jgi:hypothetical protein
MAVLLDQPERQASRPRVLQLLGAPEEQQPVLPVVQAAGSVVRPVVSSPAWPLMAEVLPDALAAQALRLRLSAA